MSLESIDEGGGGVGGGGGGGGSSSGGGGSSVARVPLFLTVFAADTITRHVTKTEKARDEQWLNKHQSRMLKPAAATRGASSSEVGALRYEADVRYRLERGVTWRRHCAELLVPSVGFIGLAMRGACSLRAYRIVSATLASNRCGGSKLFSVRRAPLLPFNVKKPTRQSDAFSKF